MINKTGQNLSVLILTEPAKDWQAFAAWYSVFKSLPEAKTGIVCQRNGETPFQFFQWAKRLKVPVIKTNKFSDDLRLVNDLNCISHAIKHNLVGTNILVFRDLCLALEPLNAGVLEQLNKGINIYNEQFWFIKAETVDSLIEKSVLENAELEYSNFVLGTEAKTTENAACLVSYYKGCGRWINTAKGCPFSSAAGLTATNMTVNETRIIDLWKKMVPLYYAVS